MIDNRYREVKDLSAGSYGKVWTWVTLDEAQSQVAVKVYVKKQSDSDGEIRHFQSEWEALSALHHQYIINLLDYNDSGVRVDADGTQTSVRYAALELAENGNLLDYVVNRSMSDSIVRYYFKQLLEAMEYTHDRGFCHRDLKLENILLDKEYNIKVSDFGFANSLAGDKNDNKLYACKGTKRYMAPEIFKGTGYLGRSVDIFALGVILFSMKTGNPPFDNATPQDYYYRFLQCYHYEGYWPIWDHHARNSGFELPVEFKNLFVAMVWFYPTTRLSLTEIMKDDWMRGPIATKVEVQMYMRAIQDEMAQNEEKQYGQQASARSRYVVNMKNEEDFDVKEDENYIDDVIQIDEKDKGKVIHSDIEDELDLEDDDGFDLGDEMDDQSIEKRPDFSDDEESKEKEVLGDPKDPNSLIVPKVEEIDTGFATFYADKIWEYLIEYAEINNFKAFFDISDFTLNFNIANNRQMIYFGMKFIFIGSENMDTSNAGQVVRNSYRIYFLKDFNFDEEEFKDMGLQFLDQISNYI
jgi:hypothetical protein